MVIRQVKRALMQKVIVRLVAQPHTIVKGVECKREVRGRKNDKKEVKHDESDFGLGITETQGF